MTKAGYCPQCGAKVEFRFDSTVQTTCEFCRSILVRTDVDIQRVGEVAELADYSPIQIGTEGVYQGRSFLVAGRIAYEYANGGWSEWHIVFSDGASGWLSDAQAEYAVTFLAQPEKPLPAESDLQRGFAVNAAGAQYQAATMTRARYAGVQGELPFEYWDKSEVLFADLKSETTRFGTIDYSEEPPLLFLGEYVEFDALRLKNLRDDSQAEAKVKSQALVCPNCGAAVELRTGAAAVSAVCPKCLSVLDAQSPALRILQRVKAKQRVKPLIPLGTRGRLHGDEYTVTGFQTRAIVVDGTTYEWREYVLFSRTKGFRYLTEYDGHWNDVKPLQAQPATGESLGKKTAQYLGLTYRHFQNAQAATTYVMGEFPWQARVGDRAVCDDYVAPPYMLSSESTDGEVTWSLGEYRKGEDIWQAFGLKDAPPPAVGIYANQPSPYQGKVWSAWKICAMLELALLVLMLLTVTFTRNEQVFRSSYGFRQGAAGEQSFVTPVFDLKGRASNVVVEIRTNLDNYWAYFSMALIREDTGEAWDFAREVSYYHGRDSDGSWTEGSPRDAVTIPTIPAGRYYLRVEPEMESVGTGLTTVPHSMQYEIRVRRDVPSYWIFFAGMIFLLIPPVLTAFRSAAYEGRRWQESDYAGSSDSSDSDEGDDE